VTPLRIWRNRLVLLLRKIRLVACLGLVAGVLPMSVTAHAETAPSLQKSISIADNPGGNIANFAVSLASYRSAGTLVKFTGQCDSSCTLYLSLPREQTCLTRGASFRFHAPSAASRRSKQIAQDFLMAKYPDWVRSWIVDHNGLTRQLITMNYAYASKHMRSCDTLAAR
jgi:hypothetical protein